MSAEKISREAARRVIGRRVRAVDKALSAMLLVMAAELPDDPAGVDLVRGMVANVRTALSQRYPRMKIGE